MTKLSDKAFTLLHVEDSELDARALRRALARLGIEVDVTRAKDGIEALEFLGTSCHEPTESTQTVILLDINMPRMNGIEFLKELRANQALRHTPVFVLTTSERRSDIHNAYAHNVAGYIVKPMDSNVFHERIEMWQQFMSVIELPCAA
ncbi:response regulator [Roseovarius sp. CAU 1744]|uniref:response regulator n=1 Tax=Roseovarius sp. CAU 1744 TaxID=3140368 RepID=UPI00325A4671